MYRTHLRTRNWQRPNGSLLSHGLTQNAVLLRSPVQSLCQQKDIPSYAHSANSSLSASGDMVRPSTLFIRTKSHTATPLQGILSINANHINIVAGYTNGQYNASVSHSQQPRIPVQNDGHHFGRILLDQNEVLNRSAAGTILE